MQYSTGKCIMTSKVIFNINIIVVIMIIATTTTTVVIVVAAVDLVMLFRAGL